MATYASATNPFIKPTNGRARAGDTADEKSDTVERSQGKSMNAPGMARLQSKRERKRARRRERGNLLSCADQNSTNSANEQNGHEESDNESEKPTGAANLKVDDNDNLLLGGESCGGEATAGAVKEEQKQISSEEAADIAEEVCKVIDLTDLSLNECSLRRLSTGYSETLQLAVSSSETGQAKSIGDTDQAEDDGMPGQKDEEGEEEEEVPNGGAAEERAPMIRDGRKQQHQHIELIKKLRLQLRDLERYAYERGELEEAPPSVLAERQTVILDSLKRKLPLNIDEDRIERLELEELKSQVDKEISELIDPLITKDHLLNQLKTQLTDLERYISHLHETLGKNIDRRAIAGADCSCQVHGCLTPSHLTKSSSVTFKTLGATGDNTEDMGQREASSTLMDNETLPKTSRLIRGLMAQLICSDIKIQEAMKMKKDYAKYPGNAVQCAGPKEGFVCQGDDNSEQTTGLRNNTTIKAPQFHDGAVWTMHIDRVVLATDSLTNLFGIEPNGCNTKPDGEEQRAAKQQVDESLVESVVRRQLVTAMRDLLAYGLIDPHSAPRSSYRSFLFDPYYIISSLTCLPGTQSYDQQDTTSLPQDKIHVWNVIEDYFNSHNEPEFKTSSVKTLSQSFNLTPSPGGPIKLTSKQGLLIALDDIIERLARSKPNGPESHFKMFVYTALNHGKLASWIRIIFRSKSVLRKFYHNFSFVNQPDKMDKFLQVIDALNQIEFRLNTDTGLVNRPLVRAF